MSNVEVIYNDFAPYAKADASYSCSDKQVFVDLTDLKSETLEFDNRASLEMSYMSVDKPYSLKTITSGFGYISNSQSDATGQFAAGSQPLITINFSVKHSANGLTIVFDNEGGTICSKLLISWYSDSTVIDTQTFYPDKVSFYCSNPVKNFNKIAIQILETNIGNRWARIQRIDFGSKISYSDEEVKESTVTENINIAAEQLNTNTSHLLLDIQEDYIFQKSQSFEIYKNDKLQAYHFLTSAKKDKGGYAIELSDYTAILDKLDFPETTFENIRFDAFIGSLFAGTNITVGIITDALAGALLNGKIKACTKREALLCACFAVAAVVFTSKNYGVILKPAYDILTGPVVGTFDDSNTFNGAKLDIKEPYSAINVIKIEGDTKTDNLIYNPDVNVYDNQGIKKFEVELWADIDYLLSVLALYYFNNMLGTCKLVLEDEELGDKITADIDGIKNCIIQKLTKNLSYGKNIVDAEVKVC
jgi:hypothetical protein